jgi:hypothetical protein
MTPIGTLADYLGVGSEEVELSVSWQDVALYVGAELFGELYYRTDWTPGQWLDQMTTLVSQFKTQIKSVHGAVDRAREQHAALCAEVRDLKARLALHGDFR